MGTIELTNYQIAEIDVFNIGNMPASELYLLPELHTIAKQLKIDITDTRGFSKAVLYLKVSVTQN